MNVAHRSFGGQDHVNVIGHSAAEQTLVNWINEFYHVERKQQDIKVGNVH